MAKRGIFWIFLVYAIFGVYLLNKFFTFIPLPESFASVDSWIFLISGILLIVGGINFMRLARARPGYF